ncbi:MAG: AAA family ATPase [Actinomycetota bacterium]|nr:AAA family ATPase [Actinomycetota bacterium]
MLNCSACGTPLPETHRFCAACGAPAAGWLLPLAPDGAPAGIRKNVVVLFADLVGSTELGEALDPEPLRQILEQYFARCAACITGQGGTVEKYIGDAVMAIFGVPAVREDDALRAVLAGSEIIAAIEDYSAALAREHGVTMRVRVGIAAGEVMVSRRTSGDLHIVGDTLNTASRLQSAAGPGEVILGPSAADLVRGQVAVEPVGPLVLKGKAEPVRAWRLVSAVPLAEHRTPVPMVNRAEEIALLRDAYTRAAERRQASFVTILGGPGIGKSRLVAEFLPTATDATVLSASCRSTGRGWTYQPVSDLIRSCGLNRIEDLLGSRPDGLRALRWLGQVAGQGSAPTGSEPGSVEEISWAVTLLLDMLAESRPLVVIWEDIQWAEPTLLDLIEDASGWLTDAPIMTLCIGRPELIESRPRWGGGKPFGSTFELAPMSPEHTAELVTALAGDGPAATGRARELVAAACEGNPLFAELMLGLIADGGAVGAIPPTVQAMLEARIDQLPPSQRDLLQRAAILGREFARADLAALCGDRAGDRAIDADLRHLIRRNLLGRAERGGGMRFSQALIRDTAYAMTPKADRQRWHQLAADALAGDLAGPGANAPHERFAYHLEAACLLRRELRPSDPELGALAERAAAALLAQGAMASRRGDLPAAAGLLTRGRDLLPPGDPRHVALALRISDAHLGLLENREALAAVAVAEQQRGGDPRAAAACEVQRLIVGIRMNLRPLTEVARAADAIAARIAGDPGDHLSQGRLHQLAAMLRFADDRIGPAEESLRAALTHARALGDRAEEDRLLSGICEVTLWGPTPARDGLALCDELRARFADNRALLAPVALTSAGLLALTGDLAAAMHWLAEARSYAADLHLRLASVVVRQAAGFVHAVAGQHLAAAEEYLGAAADLRAAVGTVPGARTLEVRAARELLAGGRPAAAREVIADGSADGAGDRPDERGERPGDQGGTDDQRDDPSGAMSDPVTRLMAAAVRALLDSAAGRHERATLAAEHVASLIGQTDNLILRGDVLFDCARVFRAAGDAETGRSLATRAGDQYLAKGADLPAAIVRDWIAADVENRFDNY